MFSILRKARDQTKPGSLFSRSGGRGERDPGNEVGQDGMFFSYKASHPFFKVLHNYIFLCRDDHLKITNDKGHAFGVFYQDNTGKAVLVTGTFVFIKFHYYQYTRPN